MKMPPDAKPFVPTDMHSLRGWRQIEDRDEVDQTLERIGAMPCCDVYQCPDLYELAYPGYQGDLEYYLDKGREGKVLYVGLGTGRIFAPLARQNPEALGIESSPQMLDLFHRRHPDIAPGRLIQADAATADLPEDHFDAVLAPYSFLQVIAEEKLRKLLANVRRWLNPVGRFSTDTFSPYLVPFCKRGLEASIRCIGPDTRVAIYVLYDHLRQSMTEMALICSGGQERLLRMHLHYYFPHELRAACQAAGFDEVRIFGGYCGEPFDPCENEVIVYEAQRRGIAENPLPTPLASRQIFPCPMRQRP